MKYLKLFFAIVVFSLFAGCNDDDTHSNASVYGPWKLVKVQGGIAGTTDNFEPGLITWTFNSANQTITVVNNNTNDSANDVFESGNYNFQVLNVDDNGFCESQLTIDELFQGCLQVNASTMVISQLAADGFELTLQR